MPHNQLDSHELETRYPSLEAVDDVDIADLSRLEDESLYSAGMKVVQNILREMNEVGRTRSITAANADTTKHGKARDAPQASASRRRSVGVVVGEDRSGFGPGVGRSGWTVDASGIQMCALRKRICDKYGYEQSSAQVFRGDFYAPHLPPSDYVHGASVVAVAEHVSVPTSNGGTRQTCDRQKCNVFRHVSDSLILNEPNHAVGPRSKNRGTNTLCMTNQDIGKVSEISLSLCTSADLVQYVTLILRTINLCVEELLRHLLQGGVLASLIAIL